MDKIKPYLNGLKKHHFWLLTAICVIVTLYCWNSATNEIRAQFDKNKKKVQAEFAKIDAIGRRSQFPNGEWQKKAAEKNGEVVGQIRKAADRIIKDQKTVLAWSEDVWSEPFRKVASTPPTGWQEEAIEEFRLQMPEDVKRLRTILQAADDIHAPGVQWNAEDYDRLLTAYTMNEVNPAAIMTMREIYWVFEALANVIATTNEGVDDKYNLPIHDLEILAVGDQHAKTTLPADWEIPGLAAPAAARTPPQRTGYTIRPVRMRVRMDLRKLNKLLTACANSELPLDIQGLRIVRPSELVEIKETEQQPEEQFKVGRGFGRRDEDAKEEESQEPEVVKRGTLVEIIGDVYFVNEQNMQGEISKTGQQTTLHRKSGNRALLALARH